VYGGNRAQSIISIDPEFAENAKVEKTYSRNIFIRNNQIKTFDSPLLFANAVDGLVFEGNNITQTDKYTPIFPNNPNLKILNSNRVTISNNVYKTLNGKKGTLSIDDKTTNILLNNNQFFDRIN
jgi:hypothetical protein